MKKILVTLLALGAFAPSAFAKPLDQDLQSWVVLIGQGPASQNLRAYLEVQPRFGANLSNVDKLLIRPAAYYALTPHLTVWAGYAWQPAFQPVYVNENRIWQQVQHDDYCGSFRLINRSRLEERMVEGTSGTAIRFRQMLRSLYALDEKREWNALVQEEIFFNLNTLTKGSRAGLDQNRFSIGANHKFSSLFSMDVAYMANFVRRPTSDSDRFNHVILINNYFNF